MPRKVLVTGGGGFIGSRLCMRLAAGGADVHATTRTCGRADRDGVHWRQIDLSDVGSLRELLAAIEPEVVFHLASHVAGARDLTLVLPTFRGNLMSTVNVLTVAQELGCGRIVLAGSMEEPELPEDVPVSPYAITKWASGAYARMFHALFGTPVVTLRTFMVYGPGQRDSTKLIPYVVLSLLRGDRPHLASGSRPIDWVYVDDVVDAFLAAADADGVFGRSIDVGSGELVTIAAVVERLCRLTGAVVEPIFGALPDRPLETIRRADVGVAAGALGWTPTTSLDDGLARTVAWFSEQTERTACASEVV